MKEQIIEELKDQGFYSIAETLEDEKPSASEMRYLQTDVEKAYRQNTREEFPTKDYYRVIELIDLWFLHQKETERRDEKNGLYPDRWDNSN